MKKKEEITMSWIEKMVLLNELQKADERRKMRMTDEEINKLYLKYADTKFGWQLEFARAIEERHGIK
jgi:hypothetical protein